MSQVSENLSISQSDEVSVTEKLQQAHNHRDALTAFSNATVNNAAGQTITAAQLVSGALIRSGGAALSDTTATATQLVAQCPHVAVNDTFEFSITNNNTGILTLVGGTGVTLAGSTQVSVGATRLFVAKFTNVTTAKAVTITGLGEQMQDSSITGIPQAVNALANAAGQTLTVAQVLGGVLVRSGAAGVSDTTPTAALLVAAVPNAFVGQCFDFTIVNNNSGTLTIVAGTNVTLAGTTSILTVNTRQYRAKFTNVTPSSEAVTITGLFTAAN